MDRKVYTKSITSGYVETRRGCGSGVPNRCRRRARDQAQKCLTKFWENPDQLPQECKKGGSVPVFSSAYAYLGPREAITLDVANFVGFVSANGKDGPGNVVDPASLRDGSIKVDVYASTWGDTGCHKRVKVASNFVVDLDKLKKIKELKIYNSYQTMNASSLESAPDRTKLRRSATVTLKNGQTYSNVVAAFMNRTGKSIARAEHTDKKYIGCGRKAAQNMLMSLGFTRQQMEQSYIAKYVETYADWMFETLADSRATTPGQLKVGLNKILKKKKLNTFLETRIKRQVTHPQKHIIQQLKDGSFPMIALVAGGTHWVTASGVWSSMFQNYSPTYGFITQNNHSTRYEPYSYYRLDFNSESTFSSAFVPSFKPGTMIQYRQKSSMATRPLKLYVHKKRGDFFSAATQSGIHAAQKAGYTFIRTQGSIYKKQAPNTVPLKLFWSPDRKDNYSTSTSWGETAALNAGYRFVRIQGCVYPPNYQKNHTVDLMGLWGGQKGVMDNMTVVSAAVRDKYKKAGWGYFGSVGKILKKGAEAPKTSTPSPSAMIAASQTGGTRVARARSTRSRGTQRRARRRGDNRAGTPRPRQARRSPEAMKVNLARSIGRLKSTRGFKTSRRRPNLQKEESARKILMKRCKKELLKHCKAAVPHNRGWYKCLKAKQNALSRTCTSGLRAAAVR